MFSDPEKDGRVLEASWETVLIRIGILYKARTVSGVLEAKCPFCRQSSRNLNLWDKSGRFKCSDCGEEGDKVDLVHQVYPQRNLEEIFQQFGEIQRYRRLPKGDHPEFTLG